MRTFVIVAALVMVGGAAMLSGFGGSAIVLPFAATVLAATIGAYLLRRRTPGP